MTADCTEKIFIEISVISDIDFLKVIIAIDVYLFKEIKTNTVEKVICLNNKTYHEVKLNIGCTRGF